MRFKKFIAKIGVGALILASAFSSFTPEVYAGTFTHVHTSACNKEVTKTCKDHFLRYGREFSTNHCPQCGCMRECQTDGYMDVCPQGLVPEEYVGWTVTCLSCGYVLDKREAGKPKTHTYKTVERACGKDSGTVVATVSASADSTGWTNQDVGLSVNVNVTDSSFGVSSITFNGNPSGGSERVSENGTYTFTVKGNNKQSVSESVTVSNIDKTPPTISLSKSTDEWTEEGLTISASVSDDLSGVVGISFNGGEYSGASSMSVTSNGTYSASVKDAAGNTASASITISNIGRDPAVIEEEKRREEEERRKQEEEEKRRREEEEKRKQEEEEKKRREEEEKSRKDEGSGNETDNKEPEKKEEPEKEKPDGKNDFTGIISRIIGKETDEPELEDVSAGDVSGADVSGNLIDFNGKNGKGEGKKNTTGTKIAEYKTLPVETVEASGWWSKFLENPLPVLLTGFLMIVLGFFLLVSLNYVYIKDGDKVKPISLARVRPCKEKLFVRIPSGNLDGNTHYRLFFSPWSKFLKKGRSVVIDVDGHNVPLVSEDGMGFVYNC